MKKDLSNKSSNYLKIGQAAKAIGVSIDTLRRWERAGKITTVRTPGGTRLYSVATLKKLNPSSVEHFHATSQSTEELLKLASQGEALETQPFEIATEPEAPRNDDFKRNFATKFLISSAVVSVITLAVTSWITASYLTHPKEAQQFFKNNVATGLLSPFHKLAEGTMAVINPEKAEELGFIPKSEEPPPLLSDIQYPSFNDVLAVTSTTPFLEINADTQINGSLFVRDQINNITLEGTPSASTINLAAGDTTLTVTNSSTIDQDLSTTSSPTFTSVNAGTISLSAATSQITSGGFSFTLPGATTTLVGTDTTQTLTNKSMSGSSNTFTNIPNSALSNSAVTVTAGTNLTGGGTVSLGGSVTISTKSSPSFSGVVLISDGTAAAPGLAFTDDADTGLYRIGSNKIGLITGGSATSGITIDSSGNLGVGTISPGSLLSVSGNGAIGSGYATMAGPTNGLIIQGNVGIGNSSPSAKLSVVGNVGIGSSFGLAAAPSNGLSVEGNVGVGTTSPNSTLTIIGGAVIGTSYNFTAPSNGLVIEGNVGIGISVPSQIFQIGTAGNSLVFTSAGNLGIGISTPSQALEVIGTARIRGAVGNIGLVVGSNGNVGIGTTSPSATLQNTGNALIGYTSNVYGPPSGLAVSGNVGIGTTSPSYPLHVIGNVGLGSSLTISSNVFADSLKVTNHADMNTISTTGNVRVGGSLTVAGITATNGDVDLGDNASDTITFIGAVDSNILPDSNNLRNIGSSSLRWANGYFTTLDATNLSGTVTGGSTTSSSWTINSDNATANAEIGSLAFETGSATFNAVMQWNASGDSGRISGFDNYNLFNYPVAIFSQVSGGNQTFTSGSLFKYSQPSAHAITQGGAFTGAEIDFSSNITVPNTASGNQTGALVTLKDGGTGATAIGYQTAGTLDYGLYLQGETQSYFSGNVGIGHSIPNAKLSIQGNVGIGFTGATSVIPANGLAVSGNVGIGTTTANSTLSVAGNAHIGGIRQGISAPANGLFVDGNVGIGATSTAYNLDIWGTGRFSSALTVGGNLGIGSSLTVDSAAALTSLNVSGISSLAGNVGVGNSLTVSSAVNLLSSLRVVGNAQLSTLSTSGDITNAGVFLSSDGTASAPAYSFTSDTNTGIFRPSTDALGLTTGGTSRLTVTAGGNLGIGLTNPATSLSVSGNANIGYTGYISDALGLAVRGNVGIGTTSPDYPLHVVGNVGIGTSLTVNSLANIGSLNVTGTSVLGTAYGSTLTVSGNTGIGSSASITGLLYGLGGLRVNGFSDLTGNVGIGQSLTVANNIYGLAGIKIAGFADLAGNVGIGQSLTVGSGVNLLSSLRVLGNAQLSTLSTSGDITNAGVFLSSDGTASAPAYSFTSDTNTGIFRPSTDALGLTTGGTSRLTVTAGGNLGIGLTNPATSFSVSGNANIGYTGYISDALGLAVRGNVGIGTTSPDYPLHVVGNVGIGTSLNVSNLTYALGGLRVNGYSDLTGNVGIGTSLTVSSASVLDSLQVTKSISGATLGITGAGFVSGNLGVGTSFNVTGTNAVINGSNLNISGTSVLGTGYATTLTTSGNTGIGGTASITGLTFSQGGLRVNGFSDLTGNLGVGSSAVVSGNIYTPLGIKVGGFADLAGNVGIGASAVVNGNIYSPLGLKIGGFSDLSGNVGVGTSLTSTSAIYGLAGLRIAGVSDFTANVGIGTSLNATATDGLLNTRNLNVLGTSVLGTGYASTLTISGNTGIGSSASITGLLYGLGGLRVNGFSDLTGNIGVGGTANFNSLSYFNSSILSINGSATTPAYSFASSTSTGMYSPSTNALSLVTNGAGTPAFTITAGGNIGIGMTSPSQAFQVNSGASATVITSTGNLGVGTTSPLQPLHVQGNNTNAAIFMGGNVGIGTTTPSYTVDIAGKTFALNSRQDGSLASFATNTNTLPAARRSHSSIVANGYVYVMGGNNGGAKNTVYYAKLNSDGSTGVWQTNTNTLPAARDRHSSVVANGYMYVIGGNANTVYYAKLNSDGSTGVWQTNTNTLPANRSFHSSIVANGYVYVMGGNDANTVYYAKLNSDGSTGVWQTNTNTLPAGRQIHSSIVANGYVYVMGGELTNGKKNTVYYAKLNSDGSTGVWQTNTNTLPAALIYHSSVVANGYVYVIGGDYGVVANTVYYASTARMSIAANIDLLGLTGQNLGDGTGDSSLGSMGGSIFAGNIFSAGTLEVGGNTQLWGGLGVNGPVNIGIGSSSSSSIAALNTTPIFSISNNILNKSIFNIFANGNVGIGISTGFAPFTPGSTLAVGGNVGIGVSFTTASIPSNGLAVQGNLGIGTTTTSNALQVIGSTVLGFAPSAVGPSSGLAVSGNVGIGTTTANSTLSVAGSAHIGGLYQGISAPSNGLFVDGNVGIGATSSNNLLDVWGTANITGNLGVGTSLTVNSLANIGSLNIQTTSSLGTAYASTLTVSGNVGIGATLTTTGLTFASGGLRVNGLADLTGNVGIGTSLTVANNIYGLAGIRIAGFSDLAGNVGIGGSLTANSLSTFLSSILGSDGSATAPGYAFNLDTDTGIFRPGTNALGLSTGGTSRLTLTAGGNVGVGITNPVGALQVNGAAAIGYGSIPTSTLPSSGLAVSGNVGVGTTSPLQALHVVGQCVAEGTRIRRRRRNNKGEWEEEEIPVEDINPDDEVLSLNDQTGAWEWHKVEKTMDMGIQEVYELLTVTGKSIQTTANHPYLVREEGLSFGRTTQESYVDKYHSYYIESNHYRTSSEELIYINIHNLPLSLKNIPITNAMIAAGKFNVNNSTYFRVLMSKNPGETSSTPNQPEAKLMDKSAKDDIMAALENNLFTDINLTNKLLSVNQGEKWIKVSQIRTGMEVATIDGWEKVIAINKIGRVKTFDLQIENTHNFVGNNIVAHNTYITGNVGIGATSTAYNLDVWGTGRFSSALTVGGNLGVGTSLTVDGLGVLSGGLRVNGFSDLTGNVGIGGSLTVTSLSTFSSHILPGTDDSYDLGSNTQRFRDLYLGPATLHIGTSLADEYTLSYDTTSNFLGFNVNGSGVNEIVFDSNGNVGIGTSVPNATLNIQGNVGIGYTGPGMVFPSNGLAVAGNIGIGTTTTSNALQVIGATVLGFPPSAVGPASGLAVSGNVGVGTTSPRFPLEVWGNGTLTASFLNGNVGIGATTSNNLLDVWGNVGIGNSLTVSSALRLPAINCSGLTNGGKLTVDGSGGVTCAADSGGGVSGGIAGTVTFWTSTTAVSANTNFSWDNTNMRLGIGSSAPGNTLGVFGSVGIGTSFAGAPLPASLANGLAIQGNVGIGTTSPRAKLEVWGVEGGGAASAFFLNGNVGIGTTIPIATLDIAGNVNIAANSSTDDTVKTASADFTQTGSTSTNVTTTTNQITMSLGTASDSPAAGPNLTVALVNASGGHSFQRPDGKFVVIMPSTTTTNIYDPSTNSFSAGPTAAATGSTGMHSFQRPDGKFVTIVGNASTATQIYNPALNSFSTGPTLTTTANMGSHSFQRPDGKFVTIMGNITTATNIYDPSANAFSAGPALTTTADYGSHSFQRPDGKFVTIMGATTATNIYDPSANSFSAGPALTTTGSTGMHSFQRPDGKFVTIMGNTTTTTNIYDPSTNSFSAGPVLTTTAQYGSHSFQRPDGKFVTIMGNNTATTNIYDPSTNSFSAGTNLTAGAGQSAHSFQRPNGAYVTILGVGTATTNIYTVGWNTSGSWESEPLSITKLSSNSTLTWNSNPQQSTNPSRVDQANIIYQVRTTASACNQTNLNSASYVIINNSGDLIPIASGATCAQVKVSFNTPVPSNPTGSTFNVHQSNVWLGDGGDTKYFRNFQQPTVYDLTINNPFITRGGGDPSAGNTFAQQGATMENVITDNSNTLVLQPDKNINDNYLTTGVNGGNGVQVSNGPVLTATSNLGSHSFQRPDGKFVTIMGNATTTTNIYDPSTNSFSAGPVLTAAAQAGSHSFQRPDGKFVTIMGNTTTTTNIYDPSTNSFSAGPVLTAAAQYGSHSFQRPDGKFVTIMGNETATTNIYDPATNAFSAGPVLTTSAFAGSHSIQRPDGKFVTIMGNATTTTNIYDPSTNSFSAGPVLTATSNLGSHSFQRPDGKFVTIMGNITTTTNIYDPSTNSFSAGPVLTTTSNLGSHSFQRPDGRFVTILANGTTTNIYDPATNAFSAGPVLSTTASQGAHSFQRPDGKYVTILANTTTTNILDAGWNLSGTYITEQINNSNLSANTALYWQNTGKGTITAKVRSASSSMALGQAGWSDVEKNGSLVNPSGNAWIQIHFDLVATLNDYPGAQKRIWLGGGDGGGLVAYYRTPSTPILNSFKLANNSQPSVLTLQSNGLNIFRFDANGSAYTSQSGAWYSGGADVAEYYSSRESLEGGEVVAIAKNTPAKNTSEVTGTGSSDGGSVERSTQAYQKDLMGIVSTQPGFVAGAYTKDGYPIALSGRVPVKVSTENGPIEVGDYLTSSSTPGVAMKAIRAGPTVGKALEEFGCSTSQVPGLTSEVTGTGSSDGGCQGKIMAFVNVSWYDPDALRDNLSDVSINLLDGMTFNSATSKLYIVSSSDSGAITRVGVYDQLALGTLQAGGITADSLNINHVTFQGQDLQTIISSKVSLDSFEVNIASSSAQLTAGDVVTTSKVGLDSFLGDEPTFEVSQKPYDERILGVATNDKPPNNILLSGKTKVKVSTQNGPIQIGDYLTSSSVPGVAMKATRAGPTVGKALGKYGCSTSQVPGLTSEVTDTGSSDGGCQGKIMAFVNVSYADPGNFFASLSFDNQGNLIVPKVKVGSLILDASLATASASLTAEGGQITTPSDPAYFSTSPQLASNSNTFYDLAGKIASLEERIKNNELRIKDLEATVSAQLASNQPATSSAILAEATSSATLASDTSPPPKLDLTPPDILLATPSTTLASLNTYSEATVSGMLAAYQAEIQDSFKVFGDTTLGNTLVAGNLNVDGTLSIENGSELNVVGTLYLQKSLLAQKVDIFNGKVIIDSSGNIKTQGEIAGASVITNKLTISNTRIASTSASLSAGSSATLSPTIGSATLPANQTKTTVLTTQISDTAKVFITPTTPTDKTLSVTNIKKGESFDVSILTPTPENINFNWWIVQTN